MKIHNLVVGTFDPLEMNLNDLKSVSLAGDLCALRGKPFAPRKPKAQARIERLFFREDGKFLLHTITLVNGSAVFDYTLREVALKELEPGGALASMQMATPEGYKDLGEWLLHVRQVLKEPASWLDRILKMRS